MKLLVLASLFPDAPSDGDRVRLFHWLRELGRKHEITLACFADPARAEDGGPGNLGPVLKAVHRVSLSRHERRLAAGLRLCTALPVNVSSNRSATMDALVDTLVEDAEAKGEPFGAVLAYRLKMAPYALRFKGPRFLDYCDSMTRYTERRVVELKLKGRAVGAWFQQRQAEKLAAYEAWCAGQFDAGFFNACQDAEAVRAMHPRAADRLKVAANGVESAAFARPQGRRPQPGQMVFVGHLAYPPNTEAVLWFVKDILPLVRAKNPQAQLTVVGGDAPQALRALEGTPGLRFTGYVADTRPYLWDAAVSVCPVRTGAGRQNKVLEAFAAGTPCVATPLAAAGAEAEHGRHLLVADGTEAFAQAVLMLLVRPALGARLALSAKALLAKHYVWRTNAQVLDRALEKARQRSLW